MTKGLVLLPLLAFAALSQETARAAATLQSFTVTTSSPSDLFTSLGPQNATIIQNADAVWPVIVNLALLSTLPSTVNVNFPDRPSVLVKQNRSQRRGPNGFIWTGHGGDCIVFLREAPTSFKGQIACHNAGYNVNKTSDGTGLQLIRTLPAPGEIQSDVVAAPPILPLLPSQQGASPTQVDTTIDILVLYTTAVKQAKDSGGGNAETLLLAQDAVDQTQEALNNSTTGFGVTTSTPIASVNLVAALEVSHTDTTGDFQADLFYLETEAAVMREFWRADVIMYLTTIGSPGYSGLSNQPDYVPLYPPGPDYANYAAAALLWNCALMVTEPGQPCYDTAVFPHEFAHNLGANHDAITSPWPAPPYPTSPPMPVEPYAFGRYGNVLSTGDGYHTIMSSPGTSSLCHLPCPRILFYSNPGVTTDAGFKTGVAGTQNNAAVIEMFAPVTAQYKLSLGRIFYNGFEGKQ